MKENENFCIMIRGQWEDQEMSDCYRKINIYPGESRDSKIRERFLMDTFDQYVFNFSWTTFPQNFHIFPHE